MDPIDLWIVGSKPYDRIGSRAPTGDLHWKMLDQARGRRVARAVFLRQPKIASEGYTLQQLQQRDCGVQSYSCLDKPTKRWLETAYCGRIEKQCSSGILAAAIAFHCEAASVTLEGFSLNPGYHYLKASPKAFWRDHVPEDRRAIAFLSERYGDRLRGELVEMVVAA
jgi:hypothetical protein